jgi:hypothetical protein
MIMIFPRRCAGKSFATRLLCTYGIDHLLDEQRGGGGGDRGRRDDEKDVA